jgi:hypothetical protein
MPLNAHEAGDRARTSFANINTPAMRPLILCRERLNRILSILDRNDGSLTMREFARTFSVWEWEIEQAATLGWLKIETRKPRTSRPSRIAKIVSKPQAAKLPPYRWQIEKQISIRHWNFAFHSVYSAIKGGSSFVWPIPPYTDAYQQAFPAARNRRAATASMSRLLRHPHVRAARAWFYFKVSHEISREEPMPDTASGIWQRLRELGSWRVGPSTAIASK